MRAVDQYWNLADTTNVGRLRLVASDNSFANPGNPQENFVPFVNGRRTFNGFLTDEGTVSVTVYDHGPGFDYQGWQPSEELMRERGRGILIMREFTDDLQFGQHPDGRFFIKLVKILEPSEDED